MEIVPGLTLDDSEIEESFIRASGPGGQNVNKVSTAVQLRFDVRASASLSAEVRVRLERLGGRRVTRAGILILTADRFRSQERNRADARARLAELISAALVRPKFRRATRPTLGSKRRRLESKAKRGLVKEGRGRPPEDAS